jgi:hypothetical protein
MDGNFIIANLYSIVAGFNKLVMNSVLSSPSDKLERTVLYTTVFVIHYRIGIGRKEHNYYSK